MVEVSSDVVADAIVEAVRTWLSPSASSWGRSNRVEWSKSAVPAFTFFNAVFARGTDVTPADLDAAAADFDGPEWNFRVEARPEALDVVETWARANGRESEGEELSWLLTDPGALDACRDIAHESATLRIRPADMVKHRAAIMPVFRIEMEEADKEFPDALADVPGVFIRVAEVDGRPAGTALSIVTSTGGIGVFSVAVVEEYRRRGLGRELTAAVIGDGLEYGGSWSFLEASDAGRAIYQRMGFTPIDGWHSFRVPKAATPEATDD